MVSDPTAPEAQRHADRKEAQTILLLSVIACPIVFSVVVTVRYGPSAWGWLLSNDPRVWIFQVAGLFIWMVSMCGAIPLVALVRRTTRSRKGLAYNAAFASGLFLPVIFRVPAFDLIVGRLGQAGFSPAPLHLSWASPRTINFAIFGGVPALLMIVAIACRVRRTEPRTAASPPSARSMGGGAVLRPRRDRAALDDR